MCPVGNDTAEDGRPQTWALGTFSEINGRSNSILCPSEPHRGCLRRDFKPPPSLISATGHRELKTFAQKTGQPNAREAEASRSFRVQGQPASCRPVRIPQ